MSLNRVTLIGHLGQDPELRHLPTSGQPVASFSIATDEAYTDKQGQRRSGSTGTTSWFSARLRRAARNT
jgi:single stranded DNA-binding protein